MTLIPGNYLLCPEAGSVFWTSAWSAMSTLPAWPAERAIAVAVRDKDAAALKAALVEGGYLPGRPG